MRVQPKARKYSKCVFAVDPPQARKEKLRSVGNKQRRQEESKQLCVCVRARWNLTLQEQVVAKI